MNRDLPTSRIAFQSWSDFYLKNTVNPLTRDYKDFIASPYYNAFTKFAAYCVDVKVLNVGRYMDWLLKNKISIDNWCSDSVYDKFLIEYLKTEDAYDALKRSIETTLDLAEKENLQGKDYLRWGNINKICYNISKGQISPWILFLSESGKECLGKIDESQLKMVIDYIDPTLWSIKFKRESSTVSDIEMLLKQAGY